MNAATPTDAVGHAAVGACVAHAGDGTLAANADGTARCIRAPEITAVTQQFAGRQHELETLLAWLDESNTAGRTVGFVAGEAGAGKTALVREFARRAQQRIPDLVFAFGECDGLARAGDPFLPFREVFRLLSGQADDESAASEPERENRRRVQRLVTNTGRVAAHYTPTLIEMLIPGGELITRTGSFLRGRFGRSRRTADAPGLDGAPGSDTERTQMHEQFTQYLGALSDQHPLLIVLDDLQWADSATLALYFHLARRLTDKRILLLGTYRPHDVTPGPDGSPHDLLRLQHESSRLYGHVLIDLDDIRGRSGRELVDQLLDREPNALDAAFRDALYERTRGSALFTVELIAMLKDRGGLVRDEAGRWVVSGALDWGDVPPRVEGIIAARLDRLSPDALELLRAAATEGDEFTAEVAACVTGRSARDAVRELSETLGRREKLVEATGVRPGGAGRASRYRFVHALFRQQIVATLDAAERCYLHEAVADCLPKVYDGGATLDRQLANHLLDAQLERQALPHLVAAGEAALDRFASREAREAFERALAIVESGAGADMPRDEIAHLYRRLGEARLLTGHPGAARDAVSRAMQYIDDGALGERVALLCLEGDAWRLQNEERNALQAYEAGSALCDANGAVPRALATAWIETGIGRMWAHYFIGDIERLEHVIDAFQPHAERVGTRHQQAILMHGKLLARMRRRRFAMGGDTEAMQMAERLLEQSKTTGRPELTNQAIFVNGLIRLMGEDWRISRAHLETSLKLSAKLGNTLEYVRALAYLTVLERRVGNADAAIGHARELKREAESSQQAAYLSVALAQLGWWAVRDGDLAAGAEFCGEAIRLWAARPSSYPLQWLARWPALQIALSNEDANAVAEHSGAMLREDQQPMPDVIARHLGTAATLAADGNAIRAADHASAALRLARDAGYL